jgi:hypothetical protein
LIVFAKSGETLWICALSLIDTEATSALITMWHFFLFTAKLFYSSKHSGFIYPLQQEADVE